MKERLEILGEEDLGDDPLDVDVVREYSFVIYDQVRVLDYVCEMWFYIRMQSSCTYILSSNSFKLTREEMVCAALQERDLTLSTIRASYSLLGMHLELRKSIRSELILRILYRLKAPPAAAVVVMQTAEVLAAIRTKQGVEMAA